jgi:hypothetical protein
MQAQDCPENHRSEMVSSDPLVFVSPPHSIPMGWDTADEPVVVLDPNWVQGDGVKGADLIRVI